MKSKHVIVAFTIGNTAGRECLSGVFNFMNAGHDWKISFLQNPGELTPEAVDNAIRTGVDGVITGFKERTPGMITLENSAIPVVFTDYPRCETPDNSRRNFLIRNDDILIGREAARYLISRSSFRSYAFIPTTTPTRWSTLRERGFRLHLSKSGVTPCRFSPSDDLTGFLSRLQKPAAIMTATDYVAVRVLETCKAMNLSVPEQIAVIGVDNDELLAENSEPPLTSILPGHFEMGFSAAKELGRLFAAKKGCKCHIVHIPPNKVVERESTVSLTPALTLVMRAKTFIAARAAKGLTVQEVVRHFGCSRNLLDLRFKEIEGFTVHAAIEKARLKSVIHLVETTGRTVAAIASQCGFKSPNRLSHLFKQRFGASIKDWRTSGRSTCGNKTTEMKVPVCAAHSITGGDSCHSAPLRKSGGKKSPRERKCHKRQR